MAAPAPLPLKTPPPPPPPMPVSFSIAAGLAVGGARGAARAAGTEAEILGPLPPLPPFAATPGGTATAAPPPPLKPSPPSPPALPVKPVPPAPPVPSGKPVLPPAPPSASAGMAASAVNKTAPASTVPVNSASHCARLRALAGAIRIAWNASPTASRANTLPAKSAPRCALGKRGPIDIDPPPKFRAVAAAWGLPTYGIRARSSGWRVNCRRLVELYRGRASFLQQNAGVLWSNVATVCFRQPLAALLIG